MRSTPIQQALAASAPADARAARAGVIQAALRVAEFDLARTEAATLVQSAPSDPEAARSTATRSGRRGCSRKPKINIAAWRSK